MLVDSRLSGSHDNSVQLIESDQQQGEPGLVDARLENLLAQNLAEDKPVRQPGQRIDRFLGAAPSWAPRRVSRAPAEAVAAASAGGSEPSASSTGRTDRAVLVIAAIAPAAFGGIGQRRVRSLQQHPRRVGLFHQCSHARA